MAADAAGEEMAATAAPVAEEPVAEVAPVEELVAAFSAAAEEAAEPVAAEPGNVDTRRRRRIPRRLTHEEMSAGLIGGGDGGGSDGSADGDGDGDDDDDDDGGGDDGVSGDGSKVVGAPSDDELGVAEIATEGTGAAATPVITTPSQAAALSVLHDGDDDDGTPLEQPPSAYAARAGRGASQTDQTSCAMPPPPPGFTSAATVARRAALRRSAASVGGASDVDATDPFAFDEGTERHDPPLPPSASMSPKQAMATWISIFLRPRPLGQPPPADERLEWHAAKPPPAEVRMAHPTLAFPLLHNVFAKSLPSVAHGQGPAAFTSALGSALGVSQSALRTSRRVLGPWPAKWLRSISCVTAKDADADAQRHRFNQQLAPLSALDFDATINHLASYEVERVAMVERLLQRPPCSSTAQRPQPRPQRSAAPADAAAAIAAAAAAVDHAFDFTGATRGEQDAIRARLQGMPLPTATMTYGEAITAVESQLQRLVASALPARRGWAALPLIAGQRRFYRELVEVNDADDLTPKRESVVAAEAWLQAHEEWVQQADGGTSQSQTQAPYARMTPHRKRAREAVASAAAKRPQAAPSFSSSSQQQQQQQQQRQRQQQPAASAQQPAASSQPPPAAATHPPTLSSERWRGLQQWSKPNLSVECCFGERGCEYDLEHDSSLGGLRCVCGRHAQVCHLLSLLAPARCLLSRARRTLQDPLLCAAPPAHNRPVLPAFGQEHCEMYWHRMDYMAACTERKITILGYLPEENSEGEDDEGEDLEAGGGVLSSDADDEFEDRRAEGAEAEEPAVKVEPADLEDNDGADDKDDDEGVRRENAKVLLVYPNRWTKDAVTLTDHDMRRLKTYDFLNDSLVDYQIKLMQTHLQEWQRRSCYFFSSFFLKRLSNAVDAVPGATRGYRDIKRVEQGYGTVSRWTRRVDLFQKDLVFIPIVEHLHWTLAVLYKPGAFLEAELKRRAATKAAADAKRAGGAGGGGAGGGGGASGGGAWEDAGAHAAEQSQLEGAADDDGDVEDEDEMPVDEMSVDEAVDADEEGEVERSPGFIMYLDSLAGTKPTAMELIRSYLSLEYNDKRSQAAARASPVGESAAAAADPPADGAPPDRKPAHEVADGGEGSSSAGHGPGVNSSDGDGRPAGGYGGDGAGVVASQASASSDRVECVGENRRPTLSAHWDLHNADDGNDDDDAGGSGEGEGEGEGGDDGGDASCRARAIHLFEHYPVLQVTVPQQPNGVDCGLYMLKFIEKLSATLPSFVLEDKRCGEHRTRWDNVRELRFKPDDIPELRRQMADNIQTAGEEQREAEEQRKAEEHWLWGRRAVNGVEPVNGVGGPSTG